VARYWVGGATGFLGSWVARQLALAGHEVVAVSSQGGEVLAGAGAPRMAVERCDVLDSAAVAASARGCEGAFFAVGKVSRDPKAAAELHRLHVLGTRAGLSGLADAGVRRVVYASTSGTFAVGEDESQIFRETDPTPTALIGRWPYYRTKSYAEREALAKNEPGKLEVVVVNPSLLLGPGDLRESSTADVRLFLEREIMAVPRGGIAFVDVRDAAAGMLSAMERGKAGERYILNGKNMTILAFFERLSRLSGVAMPLMRLPRGRGFATAAHRALTSALGVLGREPSVDEISVEMAQCYWYCDSAKAARELGFVARDPGETLRETVQDLVERGAAFPKRAKTEQGNARP
jgi:dihydroflavonol-4-reductase